jgi:hypothetical protein
MCSWAKDEGGKYLYRYSLSTGEYMQKVLMNPAPQLIQGISCHDGWLYITSDDGDADKDEPDHVYKCNIDLSKSEYVVETAKVVDGIQKQGEIEGISFDANNGKMLICYNRGARIVEGMPVGFYEGYDHEIHEVYEFDE